MPPECAAPHQTGSAFGTGLFAIDIECDANAAEQQFGLQGSLREVVMAGAFQPPGKALVNLPHAIPGGTHLVECIADIRGHNLDISAMAVPGEYFYLIH